ncbi:NACHT, LRR and PYD domains-containing protein 3 isoform X2 [Fundulus heteroclitus]|uniref:NACHT, LRR and PYD domains-containing protein 3 isoform X2 n=1 Tax=Fundulus heteroclitus TaxID=8078 RepID=UPI00165BC38F|nr:NACHT, LRR and PYD domains-containing protein 3 isoform X2 [Fundulus heteroclitus]
MAEKKKRRMSSSVPDEPTSSFIELPDRSQRETGLPDPSVVSMKSDRSKGEPIYFGRGKTQSSQLSETDLPTPSVVSMKSDRSKGEPLYFDPGKTESQPSRCAVCKEPLRDLVQFTCGHWSCRGCAELDQDQSALALNRSCPKCGKRRKKEHDEDNILKVKKNLQKQMQKKFSLASEGNGDQTSLKNIYTTLYITTGEGEGVSKEYAVRHLSGRLKKQSSVDSSVNLNDIFKRLPGQEKPNRTVLTKGVAGIGKSFAVQKFILDWAQEETNQEVDFVFSLAFRELNLIMKEKSLHELLSEFHPALRPLQDPLDYTKTKIIMILDGLDESRLQLNFENTKTVSSLKDVTSVGGLLVNLIMGNLLPDANIWITSRPAAASQIPAKHVDMVTEIRGFTDSQKVEYFQRRFSADSDLAARITSHIQSSQSLDMMCQIPIFCWICAVLFHEVFSAAEESKVPQTMTEMMAHFVFAQTKRRSRKFDTKSETHREKLLKTHKEFLLKLGKLAFIQLLENNLIFYEDDLRGCGIDTEEASTYSGFCNTILREEEIFHQRKIFFFVHLTLQEFFAALFVYECFVTKKAKELENFLTSLEDKEYALLDLVKMTVDKVLEKKYGHLDFFLRFLLGLMVEPNRRIIQGMLTSVDPNDDTHKKVLTYLRSIRRKNLSPDDCINVFQTMVEMRDNKVKDEIQQYLKLDNRSTKELTPLHCSALAYMLQVSRNDLEELDLKSFNTTDEGRRRLIPAVRSSKKAVLNDCKVTTEWIQHLSFGLKFPFSPLQSLDLSNNDLMDSGVKMLCDGLSSPCCKLKILRLSGCLVTQTGCEYLVSALKSNPSHLVELDLSYNHPGETGIKMISEQCQLKEFNFKHNGSHRMKPGLKKYACTLTLDSNTAHKKLLLSDGNKKVTWVENEQPYPDHTERFDHHSQVLCEQGLQERCYFEIELVEPCSVGLTYKSIGRKGDTADCKLGRNEKSWCKVCSESGCYIQHNNQSIFVSSLRCSHVGVYLDWEAGSISFYKAFQDSLTHLHTYRGLKFSEALYPAVELLPHSSALFCKPEYPVESAQHKQKQV